MELVRETRLFSFILFVIDSKIQFCGFIREKGDATKARDFLPGDKQYLVTRGVPCLRRATSLAYTDADEDAERLVSFADSSAPTAEGDEWVETHAGRQAPVQSAADHSAIEEIPDIDGTGDDNIVSGVGSLSLGGGGGGKGEKEAEVVLDLDDIPDMEEEDLEDGDEATAAPKAVAPPKTTTTSSNVVDARSVSFFLFPVRLRTFYLFIFVHY